MRSTGATRRSGALVTIGMMPSTYSITNGVGAGLVAYTAIRIMQGRFRDVHPLMYIVTAGFLSTS